MPQRFLSAFPPVPPANTHSPASGSLTGESGARHVLFMSPPRSGCTANSLCPSLAAISPMVAYSYLVVFFNKSQHSSGHVVGRRQKTVSLLVFFSTGRLLRVHSPFALPCSPSISDGFFGPLLPLSGPVSLTAAIPPPPFCDCFANSCHPLFLPSTRSQASASLTVPFPSRPRASLCASFSVLFPRVSLSDDGTRLLRQQSFPSVGRLR